MTHVSHESSTDEDTTDAHHSANTEEQELEQPGDDEFSDVDMEEDVDENHDSPFNTIFPFC